MSTSFNFPLNPTLNQVVVLPDGNSAQWNGYAWVSVGDNVTYPLAIPKGGTGATNPDTALSNLGGGVPIGIPIFKTTTAAAARAILGLDGTIPWVLQDGTVAAPGLAWASEPGLGWFRKSASIIGSAAGGAQIGELDASVAAQTTLRIGPRTAGMGALGLLTDPVGTSLTKVFLFSVQASGAGIEARNSQAAGGASIPLVVTTSGLSLQSPILQINGPVDNASITLNKKGGGGAAYIASARDGLTRFVISMAGATADNFVIDRYSDAGAFLGTPLAIDRLTGTTSLQAVQVNGYLSAVAGASVTGSLAVSGNVTASTIYMSQVSGARWGYEAPYTVLHMNSGWRWGFNNNTADLIWIRDAPNPNTVFSTSGDLYAGRDIYASTDSSFGLIMTDSALKYIRFSQNNWRLEHEVANGNLNYKNHLGQALFQVAGGGAVSVPMGSISAGLQFYSAAGLSNFDQVDARGGFASRLMQTGQTTSNRWCFFWNNDSHLYCGVDATNQGWVQLQASDERIKKNIKTLESDTAVFMALRPISFQWNAPLRDTTKVQAGFSAQNAAKVMPQAAVGDINSPRDDDGNIGMPASVDTTVILAHTVRQLQKLINRVTALEC